MTSELPAGHGVAAAYVHVPGERGPRGDGALGGKGARLCALAGAGFPVPAFFCVTTRAFDELSGAVREALAEDVRELAQIAAGDERLAERARNLSRRARGAIGGAGLPEAAREAIDEAFDRRFAQGEWVAVRSSVVGEDSASDSFAGQMDTYLHVRREDVADRVVDCLASAYSERALLYRHARGALARAIAAGVVVQVMAPARASGVVFTAHPTTGDPSELVVSAGLGLGEGIVGGAVEADTISVRKADGEVVRREIAEKTRRVMPGHGGAGTRVEEVPDALRRRPALADDELAKLVALARRVEEHAGAPQDLEWTLEPEGALRLLQARPITTLSRGRVTIFDNANIVESYPGISSPLTFSFVRHGYAETFREAARRFGVSRATLDRERDLFDNLVSLIDGRIYYNILSWYRLYQLAGFDRALPAWERALGLTRSVARDGAPVTLSRSRRLYIGANIAAKLFSRHREVAAYLRDLETACADVDALDLEAMDEHRALELLEDVMDRLLAPYAVAVVNDFYAQQLYDLVGTLIERWGVGDTDELRNALVAGDSQVDSVLPVQSLMALAGAVRASATLTSIFDAESDPVRLWRLLRDRPECAEFRRRLDEHLARYGDRTLHELKLETPSLREDPAYVVSVLQSYVRAPRSVGHADASAHRREAERRVRARLRSSPARRAALAKLSSYAREAIRHRENLRLARTRGFGLVKRIFGALARQFVAHGVLDDVGDIFFLTVDEVRGAVRGHGVSRDLRALVASRRREYAAYRERTPPARIVTRGMVGAATFSRAEAARGGGDERELSGLGCSRGVARGPAAVVLEPRRDADVAGAILVAPTTDPGWVFLMVAAEGLVVEKGSMLSHTAIIGRELGIPTVVGVERASQIIADGDQLEIDGSAGVVRIAARAPAEEAREV